MPFDGFGQCFLRTMDGSGRNVLTGWFSEFGSGGFRRIDLLSFEGFSGSGSLGFGLWLYVGYLDKDWISENGSG